MNTLTEIQKNTKAQILNHIKKAGFYTVENYLYIQESENPNFDYELELNGVVIKQSDDVLELKNYYPEY